MLPLARVRLPTVEPVAPLSVPPAYTLPPIPTPPVTCSAPELVLVLAVLLVMFTGAEPSKSSVFPLLLMLVPPVICPAPLNCANVRAVTPIVTVPLFVITKPASALTVPSSTNVKAPVPTSASASKSPARVGAPLAFTV